MMPSFIAGLLLRLRRGPGGRRGLHVRAAGWATLGTAVILLVGAALAVEAERGAPRATITSFPLALWWALETATTVGYGDLYPVTAWGRVIAAVVMLAGITAFGMVTAAVATWFVDRAARESRHLGAELKALAQHGDERLGTDLHGLHERFDRIESLIGEDRGGPRRPGR